MEGMFAFFLESAFLGLFLYGEKRLGPRGHWWSAGRGISGIHGSPVISIYCDRCVDATSRRLRQGGRWIVAALKLLGAVMNPWAWWQYAHNMSGAVITGAIVMASVGAFYLLWGKFEAHGGYFASRRGSRTDLQRVAVVSHRRRSGPHDCTGSTRHAGRPWKRFLWANPEAPLIILGQPNVETQKIDNPLEVPDALSFFDLPRLEGTGEGAGFFPPEIMAAEHRAALLQLPHHGRPGDDLHRHYAGGGVSVMAWKIIFRALDALDLLLALPFPYIANTAGWMTAELGRQPWLVYGLMRTAERIIQRWSQRATECSRLLVSWECTRCLGILFSVSGAARN